MTAGTSALLLAIGGGAAGVAYLTKDGTQHTTDAARTSTIAAPLAVPVIPEDDGPTPDQATAAGLGDAVKAATGDRTSQEADRTATRNPYPDRKVVVDQPAAVGDTLRETPVPAEPAPVNAAAAAAITTKTVSETRPIPFRTRFVPDPSMPRGTSRVQTPGVDGVRTVRWLVAYADGRETDRRLIGSSVTRPPQHRVIAFGSEDRGQGWGRHRGCDADLGPCIHLGRLSCPEQVQESSNELAVLGEGLSALTPDGALPNVGTPCD